VGIAVIDQTVPQDLKVFHHTLLEKTIDAYPQKWEHLGTYPLTRQSRESARGFSMYRLIGHENRAMGPIESSMKKMLKNKFVKE
jgi:hypothetical protein